MYSCFNDCYSEFMAYTVLAYSYQVGFCNCKPTPTSNTDYSYHTKTVEVVLLIIYGPYQKIIHRIQSCLLGKPLVLWPLNVSRQIILLKICCFEIDGMVSNHLSDCNSHQFKIFYVITLNHKNIPTTRKILISYLNYLLCSQYHRYGQTITSMLVHIYNFIKRK